MKIEALTSFKHHPVNMETGDKLTVEDAIGQEIINLGWAKNSETGEAVSNPHGSTSLDIHNSQINVSTRI